MSQPHSLPPASPPARLPTLALCLAAGLVLPTLARADSPRVDGQILPGWRTDQGTHMAALDLHLSPGWKTYWRSPGDAGIPPAFDWSGSENLASVTLHWPRPTVFDVGGMRTIGYREGLVLPIEVTPRDPAQPVQLRARIDMGVCRDICVPAQVDIRADLSGSGAPDGRIATALQARPDSGRSAGLGQVSCQVDAMDKGLRVTARLDLPRLGADEVVVLEPAPGTPVWVSEATVTRQGGTLQAVADFLPDSTGFALDRSAMTVTVLAGNQAVQIDGCPSP